MAPRKNPRDSVCPHCRKSFTKGGLRQHLKYVKCSPTAIASPRKFARVRCKHCGKSFHSTNSLRVHVSTVHAKEYAKSPGHMKHHRAPTTGRGATASPAQAGADRQAEVRRMHRRNPLSTHLRTNVLTGNVGSLKASCIECPKGSGATIPTPLRRTPATLTTRAIHHSRPPNLLGIAR